MEFLIKQYVDKMTKEDILGFAKGNNISLTQYDVDILFAYVKNDWKRILYGNTDKIMEEITNKLGEEKALKINKLFLEYKEKYKNYL